MNTKFKRREKVILKRTPDLEYVEYHIEDLGENIAEDHEKPKIEPGMNGKINLILPNGQYHVEILDAKGKVIAYAAMNEEDLDQA